MDYIKKIIIKSITTATAGVKLATNAATEFENKMAEIKNIIPGIKKIPTRPASKYYNKYFDEMEIRRAIRTQVIAKFTPENIPWPEEPWNPTTLLEIRLKAIRDKYHPKYVRA